MAYYLRKEKRKKGTYLQMYESHWDKEKKQQRSQSVLQERETDNSCDRDG